MADMSFIAELTRADVQRAAGRKSFDRALDYLGEVADLEITPAEITATVRGGREYDVRLRPGAHGLAGTCSCPQGQEGLFCKHCAAVGLVALEDSGTERTAGWRTASRDRPSRPEPGARRWRAGWSRCRGRSCWPSCAGCWTATGSCGDASSCGWPRAAGTPGRSGGWCWTWCGPRGASRPTAVLSTTWPTTTQPTATCMTGTWTASGRRRRPSTGWPPRVRRADAIEIARAAIELLTGDPERTEPRYGAVKEAAGLLLAAHLQACQAAPPDPAGLGRYLAGLLGREDLAPGLAGYTGLLGDAGLASLRAAAVRAHERDPGDEPGPAGPGGGAAGRGRRGRPGRAARRRA